VSNNDDGADAWYVPRVGCLIIYRCCWSVVCSLNGLSLSLSLTHTHTVVVSVILPFVVPLRNTKQEKRYCAASNKVFLKTKDKDNAFFICR
jgi:hypothetical protein